MVRLIIILLELLKIDHRSESKHHLKIQQNSKYSASDEYALPEFFHVKFKIHDDDGANVHMSPLVDAICGHSKFATFQSVAQ